MATAKAASVAIVVLAQTSHEGADRATLDLGQSSELVAAVAAANPRTIVVAISPGPFLTPWRHAVAAIVDFGFPGEQEGNAVADVLFGVVTPGGKLPHTMPNIPNEMNMTQRQYPGIPPPPDNAGTDSGAAAAAGPTIRCGNPVAPLPSGRNQQGGTGGSDCLPTKAYYDEKLLVGYRWYDQHKVEPAFEFGFGMSYTSFKYAPVGPGGFKCSQTACAFTVTNTGATVGSEVAQLYLAFPPSAGEPPQVRHL